MLSALYHIQKLTHAYDWLSVAVIGRGKRACHPSHPENMAEFDLLRSGRCLADRISMVIRRCKQVLRNKWHVRFCPHCRTKSARWSQNFSNSPYKPNLYQLLQTLLSSLQHTKLSPSLDFWYCSEGGCGCRFSFHQSTSHTKSQDQLFKWVESGMAPVWLEWKDLK